MANNLLYRLIFRTGLSTKIKAFITGEGAWVRDTKTLLVGDDTATPPAIMTTKSTGKFDYSTVDEVKLPGGITFTRDASGKINGVDLSQLNAGDGLVVRAGKDKFANRAITSPDESILIENERGVAGDIKLRMNPNSSTAATLIISGMPPENPRSGLMWFDNLEAVLYIRIEEAEDNAYWMSLT